MSEDKKIPETIYDITDEAYNLSNDAIDFCRSEIRKVKIKSEGLKDDEPLYDSKEVCIIINTVMDCLKDIRDLLQMSSNFDS